MPARERRQRAIRRPPVLFRETQAILLRIEEAVGIPFIAYWTSDSGQVCGNDVFGFHGVLRRLGPCPKLAVFVKSDGGSGLAALRIVNLLRQFTQRLTLLAPLECMSAATMLALGADSIQMGPMAHLSAVDSALTHDLSPLDRDNDRVRVSADELVRVLRLWRAQARGDRQNPYAALYPHVHPLVIGAVDRASSLSVKLCTEILSYHMKDARRAALIANRLNSDYPSHSYPITLREARRIGLKAGPLDSGLNDLLLGLHEVYSVMGQKAATDFDAFNQHDESILNIIEGRGFQMHFQLDKDWHYRKEERRWVSLNDHSGWRKTEIVNGQVATSVYHNR
jgi:hypothetical protein